jgi:hypothetical protein
LFRNAALIACGSKVVDDLLCADFCALRQNRRTTIEKYRSAEGSASLLRNS